MPSTKNKKKIITIELPVIAKDKLNRVRLNSLLESKNANQLTNYLETAINHYAKTYHKNEMISEICLVAINVISKKNEKHIVLTGYAVTERNDEIQLETYHVQFKKDIKNMTKSEYIAKYGS